MNNKLIGLGLFVGGALIGALVTTLLIKGKYEKIAQKEIDDMGTLYYKKKRDDKKREYQNITDRYSTLSAHFKREYKGPDVRDYKDTDFHTCEEDDAQVDAAEREYPGEIAGEENLDNDPNFYNDEQVSKAYQQRDKNRAPYMIEESNFSEENTCYDKLTVFYYKQDETLSDESEEMIQDVRGTIGEEALSTLEENEYEGDVATVYVRNEKLGIDYEVIALDKSYSWDILGEVKDNGES